MQSLGSSTVMPCSGLSEEGGKIDATVPKVHVLRVNRRI